MQKSLEGDRLRMKYVLKDGIVRAFHFTESLYDDIDSAPDWLKSCPGVDVFIGLNRAIGWIKEEGGDDVDMFHIGDWIVFDHGGIYTVTDDDFRKRFKPAIDR